MKRRDWEDEEELREEGSGGGIQQWGWEQNRAGPEGRGQEEEEEQGGAQTATETTAAAAATAKVVGTDNNQLKAVV